MIVNNVVDGGPALRVPAHLSLAQHVIDSLRANSENDVVALVNGDIGEETKYSEILQRTIDVAVGLQRLGVKRGDIVAICSENRMEFLYAALGALCCGATITTMNIMYTKDELLHTMNLSRPRFMFASQAALGLHINTIKSFKPIEKIVQLNGPSIPGVLHLDDVALKGSDVKGYEPVPVEGNSDVAFILYSSGTTGLPKGVMLTHKNMLYSVALFEHNNSDGMSHRLVSIAPWYHAYGLMTTINYLVVKTFVVFFSKGFTPHTYLKCIQDYKIQILATVPPIVVFLAKAPIVEQYDLSSVEVVMCGAAPLSKDTIQAAKKRLKNCMGIFQAYGMTETSLAATRDKVEGNLGTKVGSGGHPIPGVKIKVVDIETRKKLGPKQNGELCIKGPIIMKGYLGDKKATQDMTDEEGYLKTGDIGYFDEDGYFYIVDRLKELIKYKGYQVAPAALESVVLQHPGVAECGVVGRPDEAAGELPTAFVVPKPGVRLTERDVIDFSNEKLSSSSQLRGGVIFVTEIPKNLSGKILRRALKEKLIVKHKL